jgi:DNA replication protein DnaC
MDRAWDCDRCKDVGFRYEVVGDREFVRRCKCRRGFDPDDPEHQLGASRIPFGFRERNLGAFVPRTEILREAYAETLAYCQQFPHSGPHKGLGLLFWGGKGTGKTHLAAGVLMELIANKGVSGLYWDFALLLKEMGRHYDKRSFTTDMTTLRSAIEVDVLLLDDLASRTMPDWGYNTLFEIIDARYRERRPTLITTAYEDVDAETAARADAMRQGEYLVERIGRRIRSRLLEMCLFIPMEGGRAREERRKSRRPSTLKGMRRQSGDGSR